MFEMIRNQSSKKKLKKISLIMMAKKLSLSIFLVILSYAAGNYLTHWLGIESLDSAMKNNRAILTEARGAERNVAIQKCILAKQPEDALRLAEAGLGINNINCNGDSALTLAAENGYYDLVVALLSRVDKNKVLNQTNNMGNNAVHVAAMHNHFLIVKKLAKAGCNVDIQNNEKMSPMHMAAKGGYLDTIIALKEANANMNSSGYHTPLIWCVINYNLHIIEELLKCNIDLNVVSYAKNSEYFKMDALTVAAYLLREDIVILLLTKKDKINMDHPEHMGSTVLHELVSGPNPYGRYTDRSKQWNRLANTNLSIEGRVKLKRIVNMLLDAQVNIDPSSVSYFHGMMTALQCAIKVGDEVMFNIFIEKIEKELATGKKDLWTKTVNVICFEDTALDMAICKSKSKNMIFSMFHVQPSDPELTVGEATIVMTVVIHQYGFDCSTEILLSQAKVKRVKDFKTFWSFVLKKFTTVGRKLNLTLADYKKGNIYPLYCAAKGIYPNYVKLLHSIPRMVPEFLQKCKEEVAVFEKEEMENKMNKIADELVKAGKNASHYVLVLLAIIENETGITWESVYNL